jgi:hypothetical protein
MLAVGRLSFFFFFFFFFFTTELDLVAIWNLVAIWTIKNTFVPVQHGRTIATNKMLTHWPSHNSHQWKE